MLEWYEVRASDWGKIAVRTIISLLVLALLVAGGVYVYFNYIGIEPANRFRTAEVKCGDLLPTISATGTIEPEEVVDVGAQVAGKIKEFGRDPDHPEKAVDYTTEVKDGTVLAVIDDAVYAAEVDQAKAGVKRAEADLLQAQAKVRQAEQDYKRAEGLLATKVIWV